MGELGSIYILSLNIGRKTEVTRRKDCIMTSIFVRQICYTVPDLQGVMPELGMCDIYMLGFFCHHICSVL